MKLGVSLPLTDIGEDPIIIRDFAQQAEELGYKHLAAADHVLGVNAKNRPHWATATLPMIVFMIHSCSLAFSQPAQRTSNLRHRS